jgi:hypothetical protein
VFQNKKVAHELCDLNEWQKIGPLEGLTNPSRDAVVNGLVQLPPTDDDVQWINQSEWTLQHLTILAESHHKIGDCDLKKTEDGVIVWLNEGMTPTAALDYADRLQMLQLSCHRKCFKIEEDGILARFDQTS